MRCYLRSRERAQGDKEPCAWNRQKRPIAHSQMNTERFLVVVCTWAFSSKGNTEVVRFGSISKIEKSKLRIKSEKICFHLHERVGIESLSVFLFTCTCALRGVFSVPGVSSKQNPQAKEFGVGEGSGMKPPSAPRGSPQITY